MLKPQHKMLDIIILLTFLFIFTQLLFLLVNIAAGNIDGIIYTSILNKLHFSSAGIFSILQFIFAQISLYGVFIFLIWYTTLVLAELFTLKQNTTRWIAISLWCISIAAILLANCYYVSHSFFTDLIRNKLLHNHLSYSQLKVSMQVTISICLFVLVIAAIDLCLRIYKGKLGARHFTAIILLASVIGVNLTLTQHLNHEPIRSAATASKPNIFIIGFDAVRPDFLSFNHQNHVQTPHFDAFLQSAAVFTDAYTPLARTFPSWVSVLTATHPLMTGAREDMISLESMKIQQTLPQILKQHSYETIYASDDSRFNYVNNHLFGFDRIVGTRGDATDFVLSFLNDFPLSNLVVPTTLGKILFPYSYANHAATHTYDPNNFLEVLADNLRERERKPLFLAVHFNLSGWPFYWFNDQQDYSKQALYRYKTTLSRADQLFDDFMHLLAVNQLLDHAIVVLMSDHGITLQLPGDRNVTEAKYQGNKDNIKLKKSTYNLLFVIGNKETRAKTNEQKVIYIPENQLVGDIGKLLLGIAEKNQYSIDTSWGYGTDLLSLKQNQPLLAIKSYGTTMIPPHQVVGRSMLLDIAPTLLDLLNYLPMSGRDGISLKPYLLNTHLSLPSNRPIFMESSYSLNEIEHGDIQVNEVLGKSLSFFSVDPKTDLVTIIPNAEKMIIERKQRAILQGDWLLAYYPNSKRYKPVRTRDNNLQLQSYILPPYAVLLNIKTGEWTAELNLAFAQQAPLKQLSEQLRQFYGKEMDYYLVK